MKNLVIPKPGDAAYFLVFKPTLNTRFTFLLYISLTWRVTLFLESGILLVLFPLPYFICAGATNKCNFVFVSRSQSDSPFYLVKSTTAGGAAIGAIN